MNGNRKYSTVQYLKGTFGRKTCTKIHAKVLKVPPKAIQKKKRLQHC